MENSVRPVKSWDLEKIRQAHLPQNKKWKVVISGGGTGGHVFPAIAIADTLKAVNPNIDILFVGAKGKMEMTRVPKAGYKIEGLWISGFQRKLSLRNVMFPFKLISSLIRARRILRTFKPNVAIGVGGYASGPLLEMAVRKGIPSLIQEQNSFPGITNRLLGKRVDKVCVAYPNMDRFFPKEKIVLTGNPVRSDITDIEGKRNEGIQYYGLASNKKVVLVLGGSLGARSINESLRNNVDNLSRQTDVEILWQCGKLYIDSFKETETAKLPNVHITAFLDRMDLAYAAADIVISRAGALTVSELCIVGKPSILVPSPNVAEDHQTKNAMALVTRDAAVLINDAEAYQAIPKALELLKDEAALKSLSSKIKEMAHTDAAEAIVNEVFKIM